MTIRRVRKSKAGTTLVEVVVAAAILVVVGAGIIGSLGYGFFTTQLFRENQRATQIILEKVETLRLYSWDQINSNGFIPATFTNVYDPKAAVGQQGVTYYGTLAVSNFPSGTSYSTNMRQLTLTLRWNTGGNTPHRRTLTTCVAKDGIQNYVY
jgi:type II secretory pathway pseudopilin PulG